MNVEKAVCFGGAWPLILMLVPGESAGVGRVCSGGAEGILLSAAGEGTAGERRQLGDKKCHGKTELVGETCVHLIHHYYHKLRLVYPDC